MPQTLTVAYDEELMGFSLTDALRRFSQAHPDALVEIINPTGCNNTDALFAAGEIDLLVTRSLAYDEAIAEGLLENLAEWPALSAAACPLFTRDSGVFALPFRIRLTVDLIDLLALKQTLKAKGLVLPPSGLTWTALYSLPMAEGSAVLHDSSIPLWFQQHILSAATDWRAAENRFDTPAFRAQLTAWKDAADAGRVIRPRRTQEQSAAAVPALFSFASKELDVIQRSLAEGMTVLPPPAPPTGGKSIIAYCEYFVMSAASPNKELAADFLLCLVEEGNLPDQTDPALSALLEASLLHQQVPGYAEAADILFRFEDGKISLDGCVAELQTLADALASQ